MRTIFTLLYMRFILPFLVKQMTTLDNKLSVYRELKVIFSSPLQKMVMAFLSHLFSIILIKVQKAFIFNTCFFPCQILGYIKH